MEAVHALIEEGEDWHKFSLFASEADAGREGARVVLAALRQGDYAGVDFKPLLNALEEGRYREAFEAYNDFGWGHSLYLSEEAVEGPVPKLEPGELAAVREALL